MANRRMFAKSIIDTDFFLEMPATSQLLYFHLSLRADDDGFIASPKRILRMIGASEDDFRLLIAKQYIIPFDSGVCVIRHWRIHNIIRSDRYQSTIYTQEKAMLIEDDNKSYELAHPNVIPNVIPTVNPVKVSLGKDSLGKDSKVKDSNTYSEVCNEIIAYLNEKTSSKYKATKTHNEFIHARLKEGFTKEDFFTVIDKKTKDWKGTEWEKYLRPSTLFNASKFQGYLNEKGFSKQQGNEISKELQAKGVYRIENGKYYTERGTEFDPFKEKGDVPF